MLAPLHVHAAAYATGGSSPYRDQVLWLTWGGGVNGAHNQPLGNGSSTRASIDIIDGGALEVECTLSDVTLVNTGSNVLRSYRPGNWSGDALDDLYHITGPGGANTLISGISITSGIARFRVTCSATLAGTPYELKGLVMADAESINTGAEYVQASAQGTWNVVEMTKVGSGTYTARKTNAGGSQTIRFGPGTDAGTAAVTFLAFNATAYTGSNRQVSMDFDIRGGGTTAISIGLLVPFADFGDAQARYGSAMHVINSMNFLPDNVGVGTNVNLNHPTYAPGGLAPSDIDYLGSIGPDTEKGPRFSEDASGDDNHPLSDSAEEDAWPPDHAVTILQVGETLVETVPCTGSGWVAGWIDFNRNGSLEALERSQVTQCVGGGATLSWQIPSSLSPGGSVVRLRYAPLQSEVQSPTGVAYSGGEVEDHPITILAPELAISKQALNTSAAGTWEVGQPDAAYALVVRNASATVPTSREGLAAAPITVIDALPAGIVPAWEGPLPVSDGGLAWTCSAAASRVTCETGDILAAQATSTITLPVSITVAALGEARTNHASVGGGRDPFNAGAPFPPGPDCDDATHCARATTTIVPAQADLWVRKSNGIDAALPGSDVVYAIVVGNNGPASVAGATIADNWGDGLDCGAGPLTCSSTGAPDAVCPTSLAPADLQAGLSIPLLPNGGELTFQLTCTVRDP